MASEKYILTKCERVLRVEKVEYIVEIPEKIKYKRAYAIRQVFDNNYIEHNIVDIPYSEMLEEEVSGLRKIEDDK